MYWPLLPLQVCPTGGPSRYADALTSGRFFDGLVCVFVDKIPVPIFALLIFGSIGMAYYQTQRSPIIPLIMLLLIGGATVTLLPGGAQTAIVVLAVLAVAGIGLAFYTNITNIN